MPSVDPLRRCVACRRVFPRSQLWRFVRQFDSHQVLLGEGMGRSAYLCPQLDCLRAAQRKQRLNKALRASVPDELFQRLEAQLLNHQAPGASREAKTFPEFGEFGHFGPTTETISLHGHPTHLSE
ncbi:MAG: YlxR family protein [Cyanobacteriota bacterium]